MKNLVESMGLKGVSIFVSLILLKPFYEKLFPYADLLIIAAALFLCFWYLEAYFNYIREGIYTQIEGNKNSLEKFEGHAIKKFSEIESAFAETYSRLANTESALLSKVLEVNNNVDARFNDVYIANNETKENINEMHSSLKESISSASDNVDKTISVSYQRIGEAQHKVASDLGTLQNDVAKQFDTVLERDREIKANLNTFQNDVVLHIDKVGENGNRISSEQTEILHNAINAVNTLAGEQFTATLNDLKDLRALTEKNAVSAVNQVAEVKDKQNKLMDALLNVKKEIVMGEESKYKDLGDRIVALNNVIGEKHEVLTKNLFEIDSKFETRFQSAEETQNAFTKLQREIQQDNKKNFESINSSTKRQSGEQSNLVKEAIKGISSVATTVALLKGDLFKTVANVRGDILDAVNNSKSGLDKVLTERFEDLSDEMAENQKTTDNSFVESMNVKAQIAQIMEDLVTNISEQRIQVDGVDKIIRDVEDKVDDQNVQIDNIEKILDNINGVNSNVEPEVRTETFEDKNEHTLLINTLKDNLLQYSELRDKNKIVFVSFYENGKIVTSKSFDENGKVVAENKFYENGELKERKTYFVNNGKTEVEVENF